MRSSRVVASLLFLFGLVAGCSGGAGNPDSSASGDRGGTASLSDGGVRSDEDAAGSSGGAGGKGTSGGDSSAAPADGGNGGPSDAGSAALDGASAAGTTTRSVDNRTYELVVPAGYAAGSPTALLILLHGYGEAAADIDAYFGASALAAKKNFILALPNGTTDTAGNKYWNADDACCDVYGKKPDDSGYLHDIIADVKSAFDVNAKRVYVVGHSNGAFMAHRMACDHADEIAAIVSLAGMVWNDATQCKPSAPVSVLQVQGDGDQVVFYNGGSNLGGGAYPSSAQTVATWAAKNGCDAALTDTGATLDLDAVIAAAETKVSRHACTNGAAELWTIHGGAHFPSFQATWGDTFYAFLEAHPKP